MTKARIFATQLLTCAAIVAVDMGLDYMIEGRGLHPVLSGVFVAVFLIVPYIGREH